MKKIITIILASLLVSCSKDDSNPIDALPAETQIGANTFGCLVNGKALLPRSGNTNLFNPLSGVVLTRGELSNNFNYYELEVTDYLSNPTSRLFFHMHNTPDNGVGTFLIDESNGMTDIDGFAHNYIHCRLFSKVTNSFQTYVSFNNSGRFTITSYTPTSGSGNLISGIFNCKLRNINNPNDEVEITEGRFDINSLTIASTYFP
jgi:hypothetical protein